LRGDVISEELLEALPLPSALPKLRHSFIDIGLSLSQLLWWNSCYSLGVFGSGATPLCLAPIALNLQLRSSQSYVREGLVANASLNSQLILQRGQLLLTLDIGNNGQNLTLFYEIIRLYEHFL